MKGIIENYLFLKKSMGGNITSKPLEIPYLNSVGFEIDWTGTPEGSLKIEVSASGEDWYELDQDLFSSSKDGSFSQNQPSGSPDAMLLVVGADALDGVKYIRMSYERTSGEGDLTVYFLARGR